MLDLSRRKFLVGLGLVGIAPAVVSAGNIMRVCAPAPVVATFTPEDAWWLADDAFGRGLGAQILPEQQLASRYMRALMRSIQQTKETLFYEGVSLTSIPHPGSLINS